MFFENEFFIVVFSFYIEITYNCYFDIIYK